MFVSTSVAIWVFLFEFVPCSLLHVSIADWRALISSLWNLSASLIKLVRISIAFLVAVKSFPLGLLPDSELFSMRDCNSKFFVCSAKFSYRSLSLFSLSFCNNWFNLGPVYTLPLLFHIGLALCLHDTVFIPYRIGLLFTRERTNPICFIPSSHFQMKTL